GIALGVALAPFTLAYVPTLALAGTTQLRDRHCLVELGDRAEHLAHQFGRGRVVDEGAGIVCRDKIDASFTQLGVTDFLHHQIASEAARRLDDDRPRTVALDPFEHGHKAWASIYGISAAHGRVVELGHKLVASAPSEVGWRARRGLGVG